MRVQRPTLGRQIAFELIMMLEMVYMLSCITSAENEDSLINEETQRLNSYIVYFAIGLYVASLFLKLVYFSLHPWPLRKPNWEKLMFFPRLTFLSQQLPDGLGYLVCCSIGLASPPILFSGVIVSTTTLILSSLTDISVLELVEVYVNGFTEVLQAYIFNSLILSSCNLTITLLLILLVFFLCITCRTDTLSSTCMIFLLILLLAVSLSGSTLIYYSAIVYSLYDETELLQKMNETWTDEAYNNTRYEIEIQFSCFNVSSCFSDINELFHSLLRKSYTHFLVNGITAVVMENPFYIFILLLVCKRFADDSRYGH